MATETVHPPPLVAPLAAPEPGGAPPPRTGRRTTLREDAITTAFAAVYVIGMVLDGRAHNRVEVDSFFSVWHLIVYTGFTATVLWSAYVLGFLGRLRGRPREPAPIGYGLAVLGAALFALAGVGDLVWHTIFGIENGLEVTLSPTHITLLVGAGVLGLSPFRAAWRTGMPSVAPKLRELLPAVLTLALFLVGVLFFLSNISALTTPLPWDDTARTADDALTPAGYADRMLLGKVLLTNVIVLAPIVLMLRRWTLPFGALTVYLSVIGLLGPLADDWRHPELAISFVLAGVVGDVAGRLAPPRVRPWAVAVGVPLVMWSSYFATVELSGTLLWPTELWSGSITYATLTGIALTLLMAAAAAPAPDPTPTRGR